MLSDAAKLKLDSRFADLLKSLQDEDKHADIAIAVWDILNDLTRDDPEEPNQHTVLLRGWEEGWRQWGLSPISTFSNEADDLDCRLRFKVFECLARFVLADDGPHCRDNNSQSLREALEDYLHCRGYRVESGDPSKPDSPDRETVPAAVAETPGGQEEPKRETAVTDLTPAVRTAYLGFHYAENENERSLTDREAYDWLKDEKPTDLGSLPKFSTWSRHLRGSRRALGEQKYTRRAGRAGRSVVRLDELDSAGSDEN